jgi:hypothetical protein
VTLEPVQPLKADLRTSSGFRRDLSNLDRCISTSNIWSIDSLYRTDTTLALGKSVLDTLSIPFWVVVHSRIERWICVAINHKLLHIIRAKTKCQEQSLVTLIWPWAAARPAHATKTNVCMMTRRKKKKRMINETKVLQQ